jgi:hypothetical protein
MIAGGDKTGIPRGFEVSEPYDSLSFAPTLLNLMGFVDAKGMPTREVSKMGFRQMPGRIVKEITNPAASSVSRR